MGNLSFGRLPIGRQSVLSSKSFRYSAAPKDPSARIKISTHRRPSSDSMLCKTVSARDVGTNIIVQIESVPLYAFHALCEGDGVKVGRRVVYNPYVRKRGN